MRTDEGSSAGGPSGLARIHGSRRWGGIRALAAALLLCLPLAVQAQGGSFVRRLSTEIQGKALFPLATSADSYDIGYSGQFNLNYALFPFFIPSVYAEYASLNLKSTQLPLSLVQGGLGLINEGEVTLGFMDAATGRPRRAPEDFTSLLEKTGKFL